MIQSVRGTKDILPDSIFQWHFVEEIFKRVSEKFCYNELRTPIFEKTEVFHRSIGEATDIVNKEMYTFEDKGGESITLRPEMTASLVRSVIQNNLLNQNPIQRLWYFGPFFRYERPQKGRLRQFHQYGAECLGSPYPESDVEIILLADSLFKAIGITDYSLKLNSLGNEISRENYRKALVAYLKSVEEQLSYDSKQRIETNPLRVLDSKDDNDKKIVENAPLILDYLDDISLNHFESVKKNLKDSNIKFNIDNNLVRGLDYYCHTVFEFQSNHLGSQDSFGGGGRYDGLFAQLGGKPTPAVGFALGVERILIILEQMETFKNWNDHVDCFVISLGDSSITYAHSVASQLRERGLIVGTDLIRRSMKSQMREANRLNARFAVIVGENEVNNQSVLIKNMNDGFQEEVPVTDIPNYEF
jgi:histidyl-tRNA synthetase